MSALLPVLPVLQSASLASLTECQSAIIRGGHVCPAASLASLAGVLPFLQKPGPGLEGGHQDQ